MGYYSLVGHYLLYPLSVIAMTSFFFIMGFRTGRKKERARIALLNGSSREN
ncbi:MAG: hypothetical protein HY036_05355 [Nitrospirae bacterium]|nr:hypothetical protein [Nitrospirota bacterium]MBI3351988.1 hypothetical protein [Nitrospirota bacterium]